MGPEQPMRDRLLRTRRACYPEFMPTDNGAGVVGGAVAALTALTSPAKLAFAAYVLFVYSGKIERPTPFAFLVIVLGFIFTQVVHDDYLRKLLNNLADRQIPAVAADASPLPPSLSRLTRRYIVALALLLVSIAVLALWLSGRQHVTEWNERAVTATPVSAFVAANLDVWFQYRLRNNTKADVRLRFKKTGGEVPQWSVFERDRRGISALFGKDIVDPPQVLLPPGEDVAITVKQLSLVSTNEGRMGILREARETAFAGFVIYDEPNRLRIQLPYAPAVVK
jgi:hypothetical protein